LNAVVEGNAAWYGGSQVDGTICDKLSDAIEVSMDMRARKKVALNAAQICDGDGTTRILQVLFTDITSFRSATLADARRIWEWREQGQSNQRLSGKSEGYSSHFKWFKNALKNSSQTIKILLVGGLPSGYMRLDSLNEQTARISICITEDAQGRGLAKILIEEAHLIAIQLGLKLIVAEISNGNLPSQRAFEKAGYQQNDRINNFVILHKKLGDTVQ